MIRYTDLRGKHVYFSKDGRINALFIKLTFLNNYFDGFYLSKSEESFLMFMLKIIIIIFKNG